MIKYLKHEEIDKNRWDQCISASPNRMIYAYSWYLDTASPGWEALVSGDYDAVFPLTWRKKLVNYLYQPYFTQQLGLFSGNNTNALMEEFIAAIPEHFRFIDIQLNEAYTPAEDDKRFKKRKNFVLDLQQPYEVIRKNYTDHAKRNMKKAVKHALELRTIGSNEAVDFYVKHKSYATSVLNKDDYTRLKLILDQAQKHGALECYGVYSEGTLVTTAAVYNTKDRLILINNCASEAGRDARGMYFLVDGLISANAGNTMILDFEGSDIPGISQFNKGFGAIKKPYYRLRINRLPWYIKWLKN